MPLLRLLPWLLWAALLLFSIATYGGLPADLPRRINAAGDVTQTDPRSLFNWLLVPGIAAFVQGMLSFVSSLLPTQPELFNFPEKERFLKIPSAYRGPVIARMRDVLDIVGTFTMALIFFVQFGLWRVGLGERLPALMPIILIGSIGFLPLVLLLSVRINSAVDEAEQRWKASERGASSP